MRRSAPHEDLVAYLVRRLLENGANTSFVNRLADEAAPIEEIIADPVETGGARGAKPIRRIPRPPDIYLPERGNSAGLALSEPACAGRCCGRSQAELERTFAAAPIVDGQDAGRWQRVELVMSPHDRRAQVGHGARRPTPRRSRRRSRRARRSARLGPAGRADARAQSWSGPPISTSATACALMAVMVREAGKTLDNALGDVREAVDFLRYYAQRRRGAQFAGPRLAAGARRARPTRCELRGRGPFACISPWNFPLAIFTGQVAAALAAGNPVLAKPAEQTPLVAWLGRPAAARGGRAADVLHLLPGAGRGRRGAGQATRAWRASPSPARTKRRWAINRALAGATRRRSCPSSPRPAASTP